MRRLIVAALLAAVASGGCALMYDWNTMEPPWAGTDAGRDGGVFSFDGGFPFAAQQAAPAGERAGRAPSRAQRP